MLSSRHRCPSPALLAVALLWAPGCGDGTNRSSAEAPGAVEILTADEDSDASMDALNTFTLHYDAEQNCLYHDEPDNNGEPGTGGRVAIVWPVGFTADTDTDDTGGVSVLDASGTPVAPGSPSRSAVVRSQPPPGTAT